LFLAVVAGACAADRKARPGGVDDARPLARPDDTVTDHTIPSPHPCAAARAAIEQRDFSGWRGLPDCSPATLFDQRIDDLADRPRRSLGRRHRSVPFVLLDLAGYYRPMASVANGKMVLFDGMNPELGDKLAPLLTELGAPDASLDWDYGTLSIPDRELVFAKRGITIFLNTNRDRALHIALYAATTVESYLESLRPTLLKKRRPAK
jgi:hypothetical protein